MGDSVLTFDLSFALSVVNIVLSNYKMRVYNPFAKNT